MEGVAVDPSQSVGTLITTIVDEPVMSLVASVNGGPSSNKFAGKGEAKRSTKRSKEGTGLTSGGEGSKDAKLAADGTFSVSKPYMQQTTNTQQDTQRKLEVRAGRHDDKRRTRINSAVLRKRDRWKSRGTGLLYLVHRNSDVQKLRSELTFSRLLVHLHPLP